MPPTDGDVVAAAIARVGQLATLPEVALEVTRLADDPTSSGEDLDRVLSRDPALSARVLKIVNSAYYGTRREVTTVGSAIVVLGFAAVKNIAVAASLARMFRVSAAPGGFEPRELWTHAIAVAAASRMVAFRLAASPLAAARVRLSEPSDAFLAGLLHDIGMIVSLQACREPFLAVVAATSLDPARPFRATEDELVGANHEALGAALCDAWRFPATLRRVCGCHHVPMALGEDVRGLSAIVHVADHLAAQCALGYGRTVEGAEPDAEVVAWLGLGASDLDDMRRALPAQVNDVSPMLGREE